MSGPIQNRRGLYGMRPTGHVHLGNYLGALQTWSELQYQNEC
jgi:tryptophanyl-tRNA synthetase